jgi:hypothetical protein
MDDLTRILLGLGGALIFLVVGAKSIENLSRGNRNADDLFREEKKSEPFLWIMVGVMYASVLAAFILKNLIFVWVMGGFLALAYLFKPVVILCKLLGLGPYKGHGIDHLDQEIKNISENFKND